MNQKTKNRNQWRILYLVRKVLERADRNGLLRGVARGTVRLSQVRDDDLSVTLGAESARLEQRLLVVHAAAKDKAKDTTYTKK